jgi:phospholipid-translocating ATPase
MICTIWFFNDSFVNIVSITFTALIFIELLNVFTEVNRLKFKMILSVLFTVVIYIGSMILFRNYFDITYITLDFLATVIVITSICWLPIHLFMKIVEKIDPSEASKVKKDE